MLLAAVSLLAGCAGGAVPFDRPAQTPAVSDVQIGAPVTEQGAPTQKTPAQNTVASPTKKEYKNYGFADVSEVIPFVLLDVRYYSAYNFVGRRIDGYEAPVVLLTNEAAQSLKAVADELAQIGYILKLFDGYRPQRAVDCFVRWAGDENDLLYKNAFYPTVPKDRLLNGYIARKSGHSRGSTVDLTIVDTATGKEVDMGTPFDFLGEASHHGSELVTAKQTQNRNILKNAMTKHGFKPYQAEWWHYTLINEPYPDTYFDFPVE